MTIYGDETGIFWETPITKEGKPVINSFLPKSDWKPLTILPSFKDEKLICIDVETKDPNLKKLGPGVRRGGHIVGLSIGIDNGPSFYLPVRHEAGGNLDPERVFPWVQEQVSQFTGIVTGANLLYDLDFLASEKTVPINFKDEVKFHDVMIADPLIDETHLSFSLNDIALRWLAEQKDELILKQAAKAYRIKPSEMKGQIYAMHSKFVGAYAEADTSLPLKIIKLQLEKLKQFNLMELFELEISLIPILLRMRRKGVRVDLNKAEQVREQLVIKEKENIDICQKLAGHEIIPTNKNTFIDVLEDRGFILPMTEPTEKFPKGQKSVTKDWLESNEEKDDFIAHLLKSRNINKVIGTFIDGHVMTHNINGRLHCQFNQLRGGGGDEGKITGTPARFSSSNPNLQQISARDETLAPLVRGLFIPEDGEDWVKWDYSQIEYRFLAHYARGNGAQEIRDAYRKDPKTDYHDLAGKMGGFDITDKKIRRRIKNVNFGTVYGAGAETTAITMKVELEVAIAFLEQYHKELPFVKTTFNEAMRVANRRGYIQSIMGRRRRYKLWEPREYGKGGAYPKDMAIEKYGIGKIKRAFTYTALNATMQDSAATLMKIAMRDYAASGLEKELGTMSLTVHDEMDTSVPRGAKGDKLVDEVTHQMENCYKIRVPILCETQRGANWGECL